MRILKIGGGKSMNIEGIAEEIASSDESSIILHGANEFRDELITKLGIEKKVITSISGYSSVASTEEMIDAMMMSYAGLRNKRIVETFQRKGVNAIGLSGIDGRLIKAKRNKGIRIMEEGRKKIHRDLSGKAYQVNTELLELLLTNGYTPVLTVPILDDKGYALNSENDDILTLLAQELQPQVVISFIEAPGLMRDIKDPLSKFDQIHLTELEEFEQTCEGRIKRKVYALRKMRQSCGAMIYLADGRIDLPISQALNGNSTQFLP